MPPPPPPNPAPPTNPPPQVFDNEEPTLKAAVIAAGPVALYYALALMVLPKQFQRFAVSYMRSHPELEAQGASPRASRDEGA